VSAEFRIFHGPARGATGLQIGFLIGAALALGYVADHFVLRQWEWLRGSGLPAARVTATIALGASLLTIAAVRRTCCELLATPIPLFRSWELVSAVVLLLAITLAVLAALALSIWLPGSEPALARRMGEQLTSLARWLPQVSLDVPRQVVIASLVLAVLEDIVFLGMLYPAWALQWGWMRGAIATCAAWALTHPDMATQFAGGIVLICLLRRTGSLRACIAVHAAYIVLVSHAFLGRFLLPVNRGTGEIGVWDAHLVCLALAIPALLACLWMARDEEALLPMDSVEANRRR
jgi:membrane protease YdiL (CAAX protease family)